jgi:hypothetical protein
MANSTRHRGCKNQAAVVLLQVHGVIIESTNTPHAPALMPNAREMLDDHDCAQPIPTNQPINETEQKITRYKKVRSVGGVFCL